MCQERAGLFPHWHRTGPLTIDKIGGENDKLHVWPWQETTLSIISTAKESHNCLTGINICNVHKINERTHRDIRTSSKSCMSAEWLKRAIIIGAAPSSWTMSIYRLWARRAGKQYCQYCDWETCWESILHIPVERRSRRQKGRNNDWSNPC